MSSSQKATILALIAGSLFATVATAIVGTLYGAVMAVSGSDATFGVLTERICASTCAGCRGPMEKRGGTKVIQGGGRGRVAKTYCQPPKGTLADVKDIAPYEVKEDGDLPNAAAFVVVAPPLWIACFFATRARIRRNLARAEELATRAPAGPGGPMHGGVTQAGGRRAGTGG